MPKRERFVVVDIGSTAVHMGEFETSDQAVILHCFDNIEYPEPLTEQNRTFLVTDAIERALESGKYTSKIANICVSGQAAFMRFVKLPPVTDDETSVRQIVAFEAKQNVPFPIEEVVWDYQLIGHEDGDEDELEVMFAVIKNEIVESVISAVKNAGLKPRTVDFSPAALYNAASFSYVGQDECAMLLDIGGKCTTLLFLEGSRFFARSIPIAGAAITQQIAKEFNITPEEAEILKRRYGFVALGGAYEEPESEVAATISKIIRNVMTRLHGEINRTINIYRSQQKGSKPTKLLLAGGSSTMAFTDHFFSEKLRMEVGYFNAFQIVKKDPSIDLDELAQLAHLFPELVGCALRQAYPCPIEINLTTRDIRSEGDLKRRVPFIWGSCLVWLMILLICWVVNSFQVKMLLQRVDVEKEQNTALISQQQTMSNDMRDAKQFQDNYARVKTLLDSRYRWYGLFNALQLAKPIDVWIVSLKVLDKEPEKAEDTKPETAGEPGGGFFAMGPETGGGRPAEKTGVDQAEWFALQCYSLWIPETDRDNQNQPIRPIFTQDQINRFDIEMQMRRDSADAARQISLDEVLGAGRQNRVTQGLALPSVFQKSLRFLNYFSDQVEDVRLPRYDSNPNVNAKNLQYFEIVVKLKKPIQLKRD